MELTHPIKDFLNREDINDLFKDTKIDSFCLGIEAIAKRKYDDNNDDKNAYKGDLFELFVEFLLKYKGTDNRLGITDYRPISETQYIDYGVDGLGKSTIHQKSVTVQAKYRQNHASITWNEGSFGNFGFQSLLILNELDGPSFPTDNSQMLFITSAGDAHYSTDDISTQKINIITRPGLRQLCDGVVDFWSEFKRSIINSQVQRSSVVKLVPRTHQISAVNAILDDIRMDDSNGRIILPTGTGKTLIQAQTIIEAHKEFGFNCFLILSPRILLSFQHLVHISNHLLANGIDAEFLNVNSGNFDENIVNTERRKAGFVASKIKSTTHSKEIGAIYKAAKAANKVLVISGTYHSAMRVRTATELCGVVVDLQLNDEAHNMVSEEFSICHKISQRSFHFTATERFTDSDEGLGMNNEQLWGNRVYQKLPKEMIDAGEMLPPVLHLVETLHKEQIADNDYNSQFSVIASAFLAHKQRLLSESADSTAIAPKLLVTLNGQETLRKIVGNVNIAPCLEFTKFKTMHRDVKIFAITSDLGAYFDNQWHPASNNSKDRFLQNVRDLNDTDEAIILYVDMLTEGIDVPGITAFMPMRNMGESRFIQGVGRATRLFGKDRIRFYNEEISPENPSDYIKPTAEVIIPTVSLSSIDASAQFVRLWYSLYDYFGHHERVVLSSYHGLGETDSLTDLNKIEEPTQQRLSDGVNNFIHKIVGRPDKLDIDELWFINSIRHGCSKQLVEKLYSDLGMHKHHIDTYRTIAKQHEQNHTNIADSISIMRNSGQSVFSNDVKKKYGTIYTPEFVVEKTVGTAWKYLPENVDKLRLTYCDPAVGDGNFLEYLYAKLMEETSIADPIKRSYHILTKCLWGYEILSPMVTACKIRLLLLHKGTIEENNGDPAELKTLIDDLNIHHGNTICLPADTEQEWYSKRPEFEGGLLSAVYRDMKYDVIVGNPPYTHLRNLNNRRYAAYPKQRDMAQVFVRWALDHLNKEGVCSYNTTDTWLNVKTSDGAKETRLLINNKIAEIINNEYIQRYSEQNGGNIGTMVLCITQSPPHFILNGKQCDHKDTSELQFINSFERIELPYHYVKVSKYTGQLHGHRSTFDSHNKFKIMLSGDGEYFLASKCIVGAQTARDWMLVQTNDIISVIDQNINSEVKYFSLERKKALWLFGFLSSDHGVETTKRTFRDGGKSSRWVKVLSNNMFQTMLVPDYNYYKTNHPIQFQQYMTWVEQNMHDKDKFLAGIDEQFEKLIG